jgi:hypothetical protein
MKIIFILVSTILILLSNCDITYETGSVGPKPQKMSQSSEVRLVDKKSFMFDIVGQRSDILSKAV